MLRLQLVILLLLFAVSFYAPAAMAHGGIEKSSGPVTVDIYQDPLSPFVGEKVKFSFVFNDTELSKRIPNLDVNLKLIDTYKGDESRDKVILEENKKTDVNGNLNFEYTFNKENYFDIELSFKDHHEEKQVVGFLVQPRNKPETRGANNTNEFMLPFIAGLILAFVVSYAFFKKK